jgi:tripartite-type tricarboxylate transporter receptor subunit TctC
MSRGEWSSRWLATRARTLALLCGLAACSGALAQAWPSKPVHVISPFPPAGPSDTAARLVADKLAAALGQPFIVENRPGASGAIGSLAVVKAPADGYTLMMSATSSHISPYLLKNQSFDPMKDLLPVVSVGAMPFYFMVNAANVPARSLGEFIALARSRPGQLTYGTPGVGTLAHLCGEMFKAQVHVDLLHVPYKGSGQVVNDLMGGQVDLSCNVTPIRAPQVRLLAVTSKIRSAATPEVPTTGESGLADFELSLWVGLFAPKGLAAEIVDRLNLEINKILAQADVQEQLKALNIVYRPNTPAQFADFLKADTPRWERVIRDVGVKVE